MKDIFVYGTLRVGKGNFFRFQRRFGKENMYPIKVDISIRGYKIATRGIPFTFYTGNEEDVVYGDILRVSDECCEAIDRMELGAGYYISQVVTEKDDNPSRAYLYKQEEVPPEASIITNGNFNKPTE